MKRATQWVHAAALAIMIGLAACSSDPTPQLADIRAAYEQSDYSKARDMVRLALKEDPENPDLRLLSGQIAVQTDNAQYAIGVLQPLLTNAGFASRARPWVAKAHLMLGNPNQALDVLGSAEPTSGLAASVSVVAHMLLGNDEEAEAVLSSGLARFPASVDLLALDGANLLAAGELGRASEISEKMLGIGPRSVDAHMFAARIALAQQDMDKAEKHLDWVLVARPDYGAALVAKGSIRADKGDVKGAQALFLKAAEKSGEAGLIAQYFRARIEFDQGRESEAREIIQTVTDPSVFPPAARLAGILAARAGQNEQAIRLLQKYIDEGGEDVQSRFALASAFEKTGQANAGWRYVQPLSQNPNADATVLALSSRLATASGAPEANVLKQRLVEATRPDPMAGQFIAAEKALEAGNWAKADAIYSVLMSADPATSNRVLLNNAAYARQQLGDLAGAESIIRRALTVAPNDPIILDTAAMILFAKNGPTSEAVSLIRRASAAMPGNQEIQRNAKTIESAARSKG